MLRRGVDVAILNFGMVVSLLFFAPQAPAGAHNAADYYYQFGSSTGKWPNYSLEPWFVRTTGFPNSSYYYRISESDDAWNAVGGSSGPEPDFNYIGGTTVAGNFDQPCQSTYSGVYWRSIGPGVLAQTKNCRDPTSGLTSMFQISVNSVGFTWYVGTGTPASNQWDLKSVVTHEMGHGTGFAGHFPTTGPFAACPASARATMCAGDPVDRGTTYLRTLGVHDIHTFDAAY